MVNLGDRADVAVKVYLHVPQHLVESFEEQLDCLILFKSSEFIGDSWWQFATGWGLKTILVMLVHYQGVLCFRHNMGLTCISHQITVAAIRVHLPWYIKIYLFILWILLNSSAPLLELRLRALVPDGLIWTRSSKSFIDYWANWKDIGLVLFCYRYGLSDDIPVASFSIQRLI